MEKLLSDAKIKRLERWREIKAYYKELRLAGTKKTVAIHETMKNFGVSTLTVYKAIKLKEEK